MMGGMTKIEIPRPLTGDVVELIINDHRMFESLLRQLRDASADREAAREALAHALIAHGEAEEQVVYPKLERRDAIGGGEAHHGEKEHAVGNQKLLDLLEARGTSTQKFDRAVEALAEALNHHIGEEEQTILNGARSDLAEKARQDLGQEWAARRLQLLDEHCGDIENVRTIVERDAALLEEAEKTGE